MRLVFLGIVPFLVAACSIVSGLDEFTLTDDAGPVGGGATTGGGVGGESPTGTGGAGAGEPAGSGGSTSTNPTGGSQGGGGSTGEGGASGTGGAGGEGGEPGEVTLYCGDGPLGPSLCAPGEICCHGGSGPQGDYCDVSGGCANGETEVVCAGPGDCPNGQICCSVIDIWNGNNPLVSVTCENTCNGNDMYIMCTGNPDVCPNGGSCLESPLLGTGYMHCED